ncbi:MAG TPA: hypothetical protein VFQ92_21645, partial [Blastocatellia bacterium]|nr:hypothetical protein [Blastocatellia bacterium]
MKPRDKVQVMETASRAASSVAAGPERKPYSLPDQPLISIRPSRKWVALDLADLWAYRELLYFLMWRD